MKPCFVLNVSKFKSLHAQTQQIRYIPEKKNNTETWKSNKFYQMLPNKILSKPLNKKKDCFKTPNKKKNNYQIVK